MEFLLGFYSSLILQADNFVFSHYSSSIVSSSSFLHYKAKENSVFQWEKTHSVHSCQCLQIFCMCFVKNRNPYLPADSSCQQTKANHFSLSLEEFKPFFCLVPSSSCQRLHKTKSSSKSKQSDWLLRMDWCFISIFFAHIKTDFVFCCFWDWPIHCNCDPWKATSGSLWDLHWVISLFSLCKWLYVWMNQCCKPS